MDKELTLTLINVVCALLALTSMIVSIVVSR